MPMNLKPQDIFVALKLVALGGEPWSYVRLAHELHMSASEANAAVRRGLQAGLLVPALEGRSPVPNRATLEEFLLHGVKYVFVPERGEMTRGIPTGHAASPLAELIMPGTEPPPVWPCAEGSVRGFSFSPLYPSAPKAAMVDAKLYQLLALVDAIRDGRARERKLASDELVRRLRER